MEELWLWWLLPVALGEAMLAAWFGPPAPHLPRHPHPAHPCDELPCEDHDLFA